MTAQTPRNVREYINVQSRKFIEYLQTGREF
jgi:hypothetical protein